MSTNSTIEWTEHTWNPVTGCSKVSPGCAHCYAETVALRFWPTQYPLVPLPTNHASDLPHYRQREFTDVQCHEDRLDQPLRRKKPTTYFVNSMSDLFHEDVPDEFIDRVFAVMALASQHTFQVLTKRADRMRQWFSETRNGCSRHAFVAKEAAAIWDALPERERWRRFKVGAHSVGVWPLPNVWLGVSVENQHFADERIPLLLQTPAAVRFISAEPLLGPIDIREHLNGDSTGHETGGPAGWQTRAALNWVIVGGESGTEARPCHVEWLADIAAACHRAHVPVFVKQVGSVPYVRVARLRHWEWRDIKRPEDKRFTESPDDALGWRVHLSDRKGGDMAEWPEDLRIRQFPEVTR